MDRIVSSKMKNGIWIIRMKKSCIYCLVIVLILVALTGCSKLLNGKYDPDLSIGEQIKTRHYEGHASDFGKNQLLNEMLECIKDKDVDRMMNLFSDYALEENDDLKEELKHLYESFPEINEVKNNCCSVSGGHNRGPNPGCNGRIRCKAASRWDSGSGLCGPAPGGCEGCLSVPLFCG